MSPDPLKLQELVNRILSVTDTKKIILFGSAARGEMRPDSDIDVLVVIANGKNRRAVSGNIYKNLIGYGIPVDVIVATEQDLEKYGDNYSLVYFRALRDGKEIYAA